jgi:coproporphyrinogen III oxidase
MRKQLKIVPPAEELLMWWACGISLVMHPVNPFVPTVHCNYRMFELSKKTEPSEENLTENREVVDFWFGGGTDLTPYYLFEEDAKHFHGTYKKVCDGFDPSFYQIFKKGCDEYFVNHHRKNERRGIGGIFYDYQGRLNEQIDLTKSEANEQAAIPTQESRNRTFWMNFGKGCGDAFIQSYIPIVHRRKDTAFSEQNKHWQEIRRGRYVEFNLIHDRGTLFGLKTGGRTESILMSLPPTVRFEYDFQPMPGSEEDQLLQVCLQPKEWV